MGKYWSTKMVALKRQFGILHLLPGNLNAILLEVIPNYQIPDSLSYGTMLIFLEIQVSMKY